MLNRRAFLKFLSALPFVGSLFRLKKHSQSIPFRNLPLGHTQPSDYLYMSEAMEPWPMYREVDRYDRSCLVSRIVISSEHVRPVFDLTQAAKRGVYDIRPLSPDKYLVTAIL